MNILNIKTIIIVGLMMSCFSACSLSTHSSENTAARSAVRATNGDTIGYLDGAVFEMKATYTQISGLNMLLGMDVSQTGSNDCVAVTGKIPTVSEFTSGFEFYPTDDVSDKERILKDLYKKIESRKSDLTSMYNNKWKLNHNDGDKNGITPGIEKITFSMSSNHKEAYLFLTQEWSYAEFLKAKKAAAKLPADYIYENWSGVFKVITKITLSRSIIPSNDGEFIEDADPVKSFRKAIQFFIDNVEPGISRLSVKTSFRQETVDVPSYDPEVDEPVKINGIIITIPMDVVYASDFILDETGLVTLKSDWVGFKLEGTFEGKDPYVIEQNVNSLTWQVELPKEYVGWTWKYVRVDSEGNVECDAGNNPLWRHLTPGVR